MKQLLAHPKRDLLVTMSDLYDNRTIRWIAFMKVVRVLFSLLRIQLHKLLVRDRLTVLSGRHIKYFIILQEYEYAISYQYMINSSNIFSHNIGTLKP